MQVREAFFRWLIPAAFVLPVWILIGWGVFNAGGWAFLWVLFIAMPSVFIGQLLITLLIRARPSVRATRAVSWQDVAGLSLWHVMTVIVGCYPQSWFALALIGAIAAAALLTWSSFRQLSAESIISGESIRIVPGVRSFPREEPGAARSDVFIVDEKRER